MNGLVEEYQFNGGATAADLGDTAPYHAPLSAFAFTAPAERGARTPGPPALESHDYRPSLVEQAYSKPLAATIYEIAEMRRREREIATSVARYPATECARRSRKRPGTFDERETRRRQERQRTQPPMPQIRPPPPLTLEELLDPAERFLKDGAGGWYRA